MSTEKQVILVTGANQGIGLEIVRKLAKEHPSYHILMGCRSLAKAREAISTISSAATITPIEVDISSNVSIATCIAEIERDHGRLDVLINNAGIGRAAVENLASSREKMAKLFDVNVFGTMELTDAAIPLLQTAQEKGSVPRIVFITSELGSLQNTLDPDWKYYPLHVTISYKSSKAAMNMLGACYSVRFKAAGWKVNCCCPGFRKTSFNNYMAAAADDVAEGAVNAVRLATLGKEGETGTFSNIDGIQPW